MGYIVNPSGGGVASVTGWNVDISDPVNPILKGKVANKINETAFVDGSFIGPMFNTSPSPGKDFELLRVIFPTLYIYNISYGSFLKEISIGASSSVGLGGRAGLYVSGLLKSRFDTNVPLGGISEFIFLFNSKNLLSLRQNASGQSEIGFFNNPSSVQQGPIANPSGGVVVDIEARTAIDAILTAFENYGLLKP